MKKKYLIKPRRGIRFYLRFQDDFDPIVRSGPYATTMTVSRSNQIRSLKRLRREDFFWQNMHVAVLGNCNQPRAPYTREYCARLIKICKCSSEVLLSHEAILRLFFAKTTYELWCRACMLKLNSGSSSRVSRRTISSSWWSHFTKMLENLRPLLVIKLRYSQKAKNFFWKTPLFVLMLLSNFKKKKKNGRFF